MDNFKPVEVQIEEATDVKCLFYEQQEGKCFLIIKIVGTCSVGSRGEDYGQYLYQKIGLALLKFQPIAVLIDMQELEYQYGDRILNLFQIFSDVLIFSENPPMASFVLSNKNKNGLSSLLQFNIENLQPPFYYDYEEAFQDLWEKYDEI
ncbi:hypothetical protein [Flaviramulus aquimarinus]